MSSQSISYIYESNPNSYVCKYIKIAIQFRAIKKYLKSHTENYIDNIFKLLGMRMPSMINNPNFYHFCSEAWILTIYETLMINKMKKIETFNDLIEKIKNLKIDENKFSDNLEILLGTYKLNEHIIKITQMKLSLLFLKKISQSLDESIPKNLPDEISQEKFEDLIFLSLVKAVNYTLNELSSTIDNKNSLLFLNIFTELNHDQNLKSEHYVQEVLLYYNLSEEEKSKKIQNYSNIEIELMNPSTVFYYFAKADFRILTKDLQAFIYNSADIVTKLKLFVRHKILMAKNYLRFACDIVDIYSENLRLKLTYDYLINGCIYLNKAGGKGIFVIKKNFSCLKNWIDSTSIGNINSYMYNRTKYLWKLVMYKGIMDPIKYTFINNAYNVLRVFIFTFALTRRKAAVFKSLIIAGIISILGEGPYIKYSEKENDEYISFEINKELLPTSNTKIKEIKKFIKEQLIKSNIMQLVEEGKNQTIIARNYVYNKFRKFLNKDDAYAVCDEEEIKSHDTKRKID